MLFKQYSNYSYESWLYKSYLVLCLVFFWGGVGGVPLQFAILLGGVCDVFIFYYYNKTEMRMFFLRGGVL